MGKIKMETGVVVMKFKKIFAKQIEAEYKGKSVKPDKIIYRVSTKSTECEMILNGK